MDQFLTTGFNPATAAKSAKTEAAEVLTRAQARSRATVQSQRAQEAAAAELIGKGVALNGVARGQRKAQGMLEGIQSKLMMIPMLGMLGEFLSWGMGTKFVGLKDSKSRAVVDSVLKAPIEKMRATSIADGLAASGRWAGGNEVLGGTFSRVAAGIKNSGFVQGLPSLVKTAAGAVGKTKLFTGVMVMGAVTGVGAALFGASAESAESKAAFKDLMADLGGDTHSQFAKTVKAARGTKGKWDVAKVGADMANSILDSVMWAAPGLGMMKIMPAMGAAQLAKKLVPDNPALGAYVALKKADANELKLEPEMRARMNALLITWKKSPAGDENLIRPEVILTAKEMVARGMNTTQVVQLLNNDVALAKFVDEVKHKQAAATGKVEVEKSQTPAAEVADAAIAKAKETSSTHVERLNKRRESAAAQSQLQRV